MKIKINLQKIGRYVDMNCQQIWKNFTQKDLTKVKIFQKVLEGGYFF